MHTIQTIDKAFEAFIGIVNLHNQNNSEIFGPTIKFRRAAKLRLLMNSSVEPGPIPAMPAQGGEKPKFSDEKAINNNSNNNSCTDLTPR